MRAEILVAAMLVPVAAGADELYLRSGGHLSGVVVERRADAITLDVGAGRITLPVTLVERIVESTPTFAVFAEKASRLASDDVNGWLQLAVWARDRELLTQSRQAFEHVVAIDPQNAAAQRELGHVLEDGRWMTQDDAYRARGYVPFEGHWMTPDERDATMTERAAQAQARLAEREADARAREAEARARTAEAEARRAEAEAGASEGIPLGVAYGYGAMPYGVYGPTITPGFVVTTDGNGRSGRHHGSMNGGRGGQDGNAGAHCPTGRPQGSPPTHGSTTPAPAPAPRTTTAGTAPKPDRY
jgi:hypothetical protein